MNEKIKKHFRTLSRKTELTKGGITKDELYTLIAKYSKKNRIRMNMPQIPEENIDDVLIHFAKYGLVEKKKIALKDLKPTQINIKSSKLDKKKNDKCEKYKKRKFFVSVNNHILDGHHDWAWGIQCNEDYEVTCYKIKLDIEELCRRTNLLKFKKDD